MAFTVHTAEDATPEGLRFDDGDDFHIFPSGVLRVRSKTYGTRVYSPGFWQLVEYQQHPDFKKTIE